MAPEEHPCAKCRFQDKSLWQPVAGGAVSTLSRSFSRRDMAVGDVLFHQGGQSAGVYCVSQGLIAVRSYGPDGRSSLLRLAYPGDLVGYRAFLTERDHRTEAQALLPTRICTVAHRDAKKVVRASPAVLARLAERCADELDQCHDRIEAAARLSNRDRLGQLLDRLMLAHGAEVEGRMRMRLPISRQDMADMLGVQPETLSRLLKRLEDEGGLRCSGRTVEMPIRAAVAAE